MEATGLRSSENQVCGAVAWAVFGGRQSVLLERCEPDPAHMSGGLTGRFQV